jgi:8-hydroxy-5-deazaflavin:NADPH oxidoreductase
MEAVRKTILIKTVRQPMIEKIALLGGTGKEGKGLAYRWAKAGYQVIIGSRDSSKAQTVADEINQLIIDAGFEVVGMENQVAAKECDLAVITVPFAAHVPVLEAVKDELTGKILIDVTVPLVPPKVSKVQMPPAGSAAQEAKLILGEGVEVVSAFQNISYERLLLDQEIDCDVLVCGNSKEAKLIVLELIKAAGMTGFDAGPLENSVVSEGLTSVLIVINREYGSHIAGIKITGINRE